MRLHLKLAALLLFSFLLQLPAQESFPVTIEADLTSSLGEFNHIWRYFGADEPNYAYMENGRKLLADLGSLERGRVFFRAHNLLTTGNGTYDLKWGSTNAYTEDKDGNPVYYWGIVDSIFDAYISNGVRPYVEIGFMPEALSVKPEPYRHFWNPDLDYSKVYTGWAYPPVDYSKWGELVYRWTKHCVERYGEEEVLQWYWETWNEPNIGYWQGTREEFFKLHDYSIDGVLRALPGARVGGPDVAGHGGSFMRDFLDHCRDGSNYATGKTGTKLDFVAFHAKGSPVYVDGHVRMNMGNQLATIERGFMMIAERTELEKIPIIIGESDPEGCAACQGESLGYRNGTMYSSYTAASFKRKMDLALRYKVNLEGALTWAFEFEEQKWFAGFRSLATNGINKPVFNVFRIYSMIKGERIEVSSDFEVPLDSITSGSVRKEPDVAALGTVDGDFIYLMVWHYHDDDIEGPDAELSIRINGAGRVGKVKVRKFLIDSSHSNSYNVWKQMGSPASPSTSQVSELLRASQLAEVKYMGKAAAKGGSIMLSDTLERQGVMLLVLEK